jgi:hypothetical protein
MQTLNDVFSGISGAINQQVVDSLAEVGYDTTTAIKLVTEFDGLEANDLVIEADSSF